MAANLRVRLGLDSKGFQSGMNRAKSSVAKLRNNLVSSFKGAMANWGAMLGAAFVGMQIKETIEWGSRIRDLADQFGMTTKFVQQMDYAFKQTGTDGETAFKAIRKMMLKASVATNDLTSKMTKELLADAFGKLGVTIEDMKNKKPEELFMQIAAAMQHADKNSADLHDALNVVFGKAGSQLLVTFNSDLAAMSERLEQLGAVVEEENIRQIGALGDKLEEFKTQNRGVWADIVGGAITVFGGLINFVKSAIDVIAERMVKAWEGLSGLASAAGQIWEGIKNRDIGALKAAKKELKEAGKNLLEAGAGEDGAKLVIEAGLALNEGNIKEAALKGLAGGAAITSFADEALDVGKRMNERTAESDNQKAAKDEMAAIQKEQEEIAAMMAERQKAVEAIEKLEEKQEKRRFDALTPEQQLLELQKKRIEEQKKLNELTKPQDDVATDSRLKGLEGKEHAVMLQQLEEEKLAYMEQQEVAASALDEENKVRDKVDKEKGKGSTELAGSLKDTEGHLASVGGMMMGAKNPLLDLQKQAFNVQRNQHTELVKISQTLTETFKA